MKTVIQYEPKRLTNLQRKTLSYLFRFGCSEFKKVMAEIDFISKIQARTVVGQLKNMGFIKLTGSDLALTKNGKEYVTYNSFIVNSGFKG